MGVLDISNGCIVSTFEEYVEAESLYTDFGIVAVGTQKGHVSIYDVNTCKRIGTIQQVLHKSVTCIQFDEANLLCGGEVKRCYGYSFDGRGKDEDHFEEMTRQKWEGRMQEKMQMQSVT